jgi:thiamine-phosphate pyrophosphorylase
VRLHDARLYLVAPSRLASGALAELVPDLAAAGVDLIQLREKDLEAGDVLSVGEPIAAACRASKIPFVVNDRPDVALALAADGVHLGQKDLPVSIARSIVGDRIVGLSTHAEREIDDALDAGIDYIAVGPVFATPTKPGRPGVGLPLVRYAAEHARIPWFAIGGIGEGNLPDVIDAGARRVVVVRAITHANDPASAAARLRALLDAAPL